MTALQLSLSANAVLVMMLGVVAWYFCRLSRDVETALGDVDAEVHQLREHLRAVRQQRRDRECGDVEDGDWWKRENGEGR